MKTVTLLTAFVCMSMSVAAGPFFQGLGDLKGGRFESKAYAISGNGKVVVGSSHSATCKEEQAFIWTAENGMQPLEYAGNNRTSAIDVSYDGGTIVGWSGYLSSAPRAIEWTTSGGATIIGGSRANAISDDASIVAGMIDPGGYHVAMYWDDPRNSYRMGGREVYGISADGNVLVGVRGYASDMEAVYWNQSGPMKSLGLGGEYEAAMAASSDGSVIVGKGVYESGSHAFIWKAQDDWQLLDNFSFADDVSYDGSIVVGNNSFDEAVIWDPVHGTRKLYDVLTDLGVNLDGWRLKRITGIAEDGTLVGFGTNPQGYTEAWIATIPEPTSLCLLALGAIVMRRIRTR